MGFYAKLISNIKYKQNNWFGEYKTWGEALTNSSGYSSEEILQKVKESLLKVKNGGAVYERDSVLFDKIQYSLGLLVGLQKAAIENNGKLRVLDFGGSLGSSYFQNKEFLGPLNELTWCIIEQPHFVDCGKEHFEDNQLRFYKTLEECLCDYKPNVLLLSSVLQYLEHPYDWIKSLTAIGIPYIIIDRTAFIENCCDRLTIQRVPDCIYPASYPCWFLNYQNFIRSFNQYYELILEFDDTITKNFSLEGNLCYWKGFIYHKKSCSL